jgi:hypothetical protein
MNVRERVLRGLAVRVRPLSEEAGVPVSSIHAWIARGKVESYRFEGVVFVTARGARPLLGMAEPAEPVAA